MNYTDKKQEAFDRAMEEAKEQADAKRIYREVFERFSENRKRGKSFGYQNLLHDLSKHFAFLVPTIMSHNEMRGWLAECENNIKQESTDTQEDAREVISSWLRGERELSRIPFEKIKEDKVM